MTKQTILTLALLRLSECDLYIWLANTLKYVCNEYADMAPTRLCRPWDVIIMQ